MIKRSFFSLGKPGLKYLSMTDPGVAVEDISLPGAGTASGEGL